MKFPFSLFGKKLQPAEKDLEEPALESAPFPVEQAVAQVQAATGMQFSPAATPQSELQEAAAVLTVLDQPAAAAVAPAAVAPAPEPAPTPAVQPSNDLESEAVVGRDEVIAAYRLFLRRDPESDDVIAPRLGITREKLLSTFIVSPEFLQRAENVNLVLEVAKSVELRQAVVATPGVHVVTQTDVDAAKRIFWPLTDALSLQPQAGDSVDRTIAQLMRSEQFQSNAFNAQLVTALSKQIRDRLNQK